MKGLNAFLGWLLMLAVLAVPSFLFFNWWAKNKTQSAGETAVKTAVKDVFSSAEQRPGTAQPVPRDAASSPASLSPVSTSSARGPAPAQPADAAFDAAAQPAAPARPQSVLPAQGQPAPARETALSTQAARISYYTPKSDRNPMLSQDDYRRIQEAERLRAEKERAELLNRKRVVREAGIEKKLHLQGIVGNAAIINGEMYTVGQSIYGGKIIKVGTDYIIGEYKGTRFKRTIQ